MAENIDQSINDFSHRIMKEMQLLMGERYPLGINCLGIENLSYLFENQSTYMGAKARSSDCTGVDSLC